MRTEGYGSHRKDAFIDLKFPIFNCYFRCIVLPGISGRSRFNDFRQKLWYQFLSFRYNIKRSMKSRIQAEARYCLSTCSGFGAP